ncbi:alanine racemase [Actinoplanes sp. Pm04-4]|uniref:Alanine racemase n=1 Tax=Paractinoplanes pyxinae TaxID=2997416 RepID=A0ABT4B9U4_9ACTN|nr:alanine racemase [Actinoplanes pyxinae]MCY1143272.1 alanine racemase [Actinoplanes pyxinae]
METPYAAVDVDVLDRNIRKMEAGAGERGLALRPHAKTHKTIEVGRRQIEAGAVGLTVATVREAEIFADGGIEDLFIAYPIWPSPERARRLRALAERVALRVGVDSVESAEALARAVGPLDVLVEIDSGHHRSGVQPADAKVLAGAATKAGHRVRGIFTFPGHGYGPELRKQAALDEARAMAVADADAEVRSGGSTPTAALEDAGPLTEIRPGVYVFNDAQQVELGTCGFEDVALTVAATVVSRTGNRAIVDAGSKILGADRLAWATGFGRLPDVPEARIVALSEHHATIEFPDAVPARGDVLRVAPNHVCTTVNLVDRLVVVREGGQVDEWVVAARGANT